MVVEDTTIMIGIGFFIIYLVLYKKFRFLGGLAYMALGLAILVSGNSTVNNTIGIITMFGAFITLVVDTAKFVKQISPKSY